jgi:hypothetical protein
LVHSSTAREVSSVLLSLTIIAGSAAPRDQSIELAHDPPAADRAVDGQGERLAREVVHDRQNPEPPAPGQHVGGEVERPALVCGLRDGDRCARAGGPLAATSATNGQPFFAIQPVELLVV